VTITMTHSVNVIIASLKVVYTAEFVKTATTNISQNFGREKIINMRHSKKMVGDYRYSCKVLTHVIRFNDGHVMPDWIDCKPSQAKEISRRLRNRELDTDDYAVRIRRSPKSKHAIDTTTKTGSFW